MEIILTVLITLLVCAICYAFIGVVRLQKRINEVDDLRMELIDHDVEIKRIVEDCVRERNEVQDDIYRKLEEQKRDYANRLDSWVRSTDRRFDYVRNDINNINDIVDPNRDIKLSRDIKLDK